MARGNKARRKVPSIYPWDKWTTKELSDGSSWMASKGHEYSCKSRSFASQVHKEARKRGLGATVTVVGDYVLFVFYDRNSYWKPNMPALREVQKVRRRLGLEPRR